MKKESALSFILILLFSSNLYAYNMNNSCEDLLKKGDNQNAIIAAKAIENKYDASFCGAKAEYREKNYKAAIALFTKSIEHADLPSDQLFSFLYKGITERDTGDITKSTATFTKGLNTAALGNSKYMQMERKFLYQLGKNALVNKKGDDAIDYFVKSLTVAANDDERGESFEGLSLAYFASGKVDSAIEYGVKASTTFQRTGKLGEYADMQVTLANYEAVNKNFTRAIRILTKLENFAKTNGGLYYQAKALLEKARIYKLEGNDDLSNQAKKQGNAIATEIGATDLI